MILKSYQARTKWEDGYEPVNSKLLGLPSHFELKR